MKTSTIRVTRTYDLTVTEYVDVPVIQDDDAQSYPTPHDIAEELVKAKIMAGHDVEWINVSEKEKTYPRAIFTTKTAGEEVPEFAEVEPVQPPPPTPMEPI